jgi:hypothetical protein
MPAPAEAGVDTGFEYGITDCLTAIAAPGLQHFDIASPTNAQCTGLG